MCKYCTFINVITGESDFEQEEDSGHDSLSGFEEHLGIVYNLKFLFIDNGFSPVTLDYVA